MNSVETLYRRWLAQPGLPEDLAAELRSVEGDADAINDRFYRDLAFGTGGLRGVIGAGTNRMNLYTVRKATQGLADYLNATDLPKKVAIAHDSRNKGELFARETARVLAANGITACLYPRLEPTPALSWAVRDLGCGAGVCVTASHNPAKYNGYKVYGADGCQITLEAAEKILAAIESIDIFDGVKTVDYDEAAADGRIVTIGEDCIDRFVDAVYAQRVGDGAGIDSLKLVYTPLNGSGLECVKKLLAKLGVTHLTVVPEQEQPDGNFPTCPYPNPEIREAMEKGLELCAKVHPDLLLGTDPDCDRCGTAVPDGKGGYRLITGNEMGILLLDYICRTRLARGTMPKDPVAVTTIVSTDMATPVAAKYGVELRRTLTGFKFIGEQIGLLEEEGRADRYIFGFEESYGYLSGAHVRDKDAVNATLLICEAAAWYAQQGMTLLDAMEALYREFGCYRNGLCSFTFEGESGMHAMQRLMEQLRDCPPAEIGGYRVEQAVDYNVEGGYHGLPQADVLEYTLAGGHKFMVRPSGTEPKIKVYLSAVGASEAEADGINETLAAAAASMMKG
ncbi:phospho-sugar mutase [Anaeromassilibacillus sp. An200]|uniref:phospho-sugar mutase n=1 Tax=Anaeromassilibacillus sp. An200 TaxID=1965587 RepID=UPI000B36D244|nr:phospho-sugar mutase [Anaeromassilibacillus sp. An200]OUP14105.1 phosphoglucomutase [Anaeromassilibacillus sp. An200]